MTCKDCIHSGLCYKENDYDNFPNRCGDFISDKVLDERPQGEWVKEHNEMTNTTVVRCYKCNYKINYFWNDWKNANFCPKCGVRIVNEKGGAE